MILPVLKYPDPRLAQKSVEVKEITPEIRQLVDDMVETMYARDGVGLAAPQVGEQIRLVVMDSSGPAARENLIVLINPKLFLSGPEVESEEGCLSVPDFRETVYRCSEAKVKALDIDGKPVELSLSDYEAIIVQHECDHLEGRLFIDHISRLKRMVYDRKLAKKKAKR